MFSFQSFFEVLRLSKTATDLMVLALTICVGLTIGRVRFGRISIGVAGVLFSGIGLSHLGLSVSGEILDFLREFGLILFVYAVGVYVGPRFFDNLKNGGIRLNLLAGLIVFLGVLIAVLSHFCGLIPVGATIGILSGATTNTPSLGAAQQILNQNNIDAVNVSTMAYAIAYPMGIFGIIISMLILKVFGKINIQEAVKEYSVHHSAAVVVMNIMVENKNLDGVSVSDIPDLSESRIVFSRILHGQEVVLPHAHTVLHQGDIIRAVGPQKSLEKLCLLVGSKSSVAIETLDSDITGRKVVVTNQRAVGRTVRDLNLRESFNVTATRVCHDDYELPATNNTILYYGDSLMVVGAQEDLNKFSKFIGDSPQALHHPFILPIFVGMFLGIIVGQIPIYLPGLPSPIKIGLAGGPLLVAILASRLGRFGHVVWYLPTSANHLVRKLGIALFLACVGLKSGAHFFETVMTSQGLTWFVWGAAVTIIPLLIVGSIALWKFKLNYLTVCGLLAGSLTDPPALAFANNFAHCNAQTVAYSTIYPMVMILRIVTIQIVVIILSLS